MAEGPLKLSDKVVVSPSILNGGYSSGNQGMHFSLPQGWWYWYWYDMHFQSGGC